MVQLNSKSYQRFITWSKYIFKHFIIVRTKSSRKSSDFEDDRKASNHFIKALKEEYQIDDVLEIKQYYIDSKHRDDDSLFVKGCILDLLSKADPIFMGIQVLNIEEVIKIWFS